MRFRWLRPLACPAHLRLLVFAAFCSSRVSSRRNALRPPHLD